MKLNSSLYNRLESIANKKGVLKSFLVRKKLEDLLLEPDELDNITLFNSMTVALQKNKSVPFSVNWNYVVFCHSILARNHFCISMEVLKKGSS